MSDTIFINHPFVSQKQDSADGTIVSASEWNANEVVTGGTIGQMIVRDTSSPTGIGAIKPPTAQSNSGTYSGGQLSSGLAPITVVKPVNCILIIIASINATLASGTSATVSLYKGGSLVRSKTFTADGLRRVEFAEVISEAAGTDTYSIVLSSSSNYTSSNVDLSVFSVGII